ncbi:hypothetical protein [Streptomyces sp. T028]|uniref:hypothetical protein n=1 Tax=Streptomyces sp. T028 TaxID=3394379 RepID=UPI003A8C392C
MSREPSTQVGYADDWWLLLFAPAILWLPFGPFIMGTLGIWCARRPGRWPRRWSVLLPLEPVGVPLIALLLREPDLSDPVWRDDFLGTFYVLVLGDTVLPWVLGYGITRVTRALRARRSQE